MRAGRNLGGNGPRKLAECRPGTANASRDKELHCEHRATPACHLCANARPLTTAPGVLQDFTCKAASPSDRTIQLAAELGDSGALASAFAHALRRARRSARPCVSKSELIFFGLSNFSLIRSPTHSHARAFFSFLSWHHAAPLATFPAAAPCAVATFVLVLRSASCKTVPLVVRRKCEVRAQAARVRSRRPSSLLLLFHTTTNGCPRPIARA